MTKIVIFIAGLLLTLTLQAQVFSTGETLKKGKFSAGIEPLVMVGGHSNGVNIFLHNGFGLASGLDLSVTGGVGHGNYIGADLEWSLGKYISLAAGAHHFGDFGLDGTLLFTHPLQKSVKLYFGCDAGIVFANDFYLLLWVPVGLEISLQKNMSFVFETEIGLTEDSYHIIGGGLNFYF